ncbi:MAG TPA: ABC transporter ATP-binding protein [Enteractinococcus sp.]
MSIISINDLHKTFGANVAVDNVSFTVEAGEVFGLLGPNGAGKTTTVECLSGMLEADSGTIRVLGREPATGGPGLRSQVGYQMQSSTLPAKMHVAEALTLFASFYSQPASVAELLETVGLTHRRKTAFEGLSGGERQRLSIALALVGKPRIAILDELTTGLDPQGRHDIWELVEEIRDAGITVVLVSHFLDEVERLCDRVALITTGRSIFVGTPDRLTSQATMHNSTVSSLEEAYLTMINTAGSVVHRDS